MIVDVEIDGRMRRAEVERRGAMWQVTIDGRALQVAAAAVDGRWSILIAQRDAHRGAAEDGTPADDAGSSASAWRSYEVTVETDGGRHLVHVDGRPVLLAIVDRRARTRRVRGDAHAAPGVQGAVVAPMPGRIVKVLVEPGQTVAARQGVVVVEAMKMENELRAPRAGTVAAVNVTEGMSVEAHAVLIVIE